jgi:hypothetical protein
MSLNLAFKLVRHELHEFNIHNMASIADLRELEVTLRCVNDGDTAMKPGYEIIENGHVIW